MIIFLVIISVLLFAFTFIFAKSTWQYVLTVVFGLVFLGSVALMEMNYSHHFGMEKETITKTSPIVSSADTEGLNILLYQPLGDGEEKVYLYKTKPSQEKVSQTGTDHVKNTVSKNDTIKEATLESKTTRWVYKSSFYKLLFGISGNNKEYDSRKNLFYLPNDWLELSTDQAKELGEKMNEKKSTLETDAKNYVANKLKEEITKDPSLATNKEKQAELSKKYAQEYQQQAIQDVINSLSK